LFLSGWEIGHSKTRRYSCPTVVRGQCGQSVDNLGTDGKWVGGDEGVALTMPCPQFSIPGWGCMWVG